MGQLQSIIGDLRGQDVVDEDMVEVTAQNIDTLYKMGDEWASAVVDYLLDNLDLKAFREKATELLQLQTRAVIDITVAGAQFQI